MNLHAAHAKAVALMTEHGLMKQGWRFDFDRGRRRFGACHYRTKRITLSYHLTYLNSEAEVIDTILHEIAHAIVGHRKGNAHDHVWRRTAQAIGCTGHRCYDDTVSKPAPLWIAVCPTCGTKSQRYRRGVLSCSKCSPKFDRKHLLVWHRADDK